MPRIRPVTSGEYEDMQERLVSELMEFEDTISDGYGFYCDDVHETLCRVASGLLSAIDIIRGGEDEE